MKKYSHKVLLKSITKSHFKMIGLIMLLVLALAIPTTLTLINQMQDIRQRAQTTSCRVHLAVPPRTFPNDIDPNPTSGKTKENYNKTFDRGDLRNPSDGLYTTTDLSRPIGKRNGKVDPTNCYLNNHAINIDNAKCGTSWYYSWAACSPSGSWRPVAPNHGPLRAAQNSEGNTACVGARDTLKSNILVHFRNRLQYIKAATPKGTEEARTKWNYLMAEVKSGMTTFGQMYSYEDDMDYAAQEFFGKSFNDLILGEKGSNCSMDSWSYVCRTGNETDHANPVRCASGASCSKDGSNRTYTCSNYQSKGEYPEVKNPATQPDPAVSCGPTQTTPSGGGVCAVNLAIPPRSFPTEIDNDPKSSKTKENYWKIWNKDTKQYGDTLERPVGKRDGKVSENNCYLNNHPINIDNAKCGTSWYYSWSQCSPAGSWRPTNPHGPLVRGSNTEGRGACLGTKGAFDSAFLVHFRNRLQYIKGNTFPTRFGQENGRRAQWNYLMAEVRSGNTTFGQMYSYDDDLNYASQEFFGKTFTQLLADEATKGCATDAWNSVCRTTTVEKYPSMNCTGSSSCLSHSLNGLSSTNPPKMVCSNYVAGQGGAGGSNTTNTCASPTPVTKVLKGKFDLAQCDVQGSEDVLRGWACHPGFSRPVDIHIWVGLPSQDGKQIATIKANLDRKSTLFSDFYGNFGIEEENKLINEECGGQQAIGWATPVPLSIKNGKTHTLYAYAVDPENLNKTLLLPFYYSSAKPASTDPFTVTCTNEKVVNPSLPPVVPTTGGGRGTSPTPTIPPMAASCKVHLAIPPVNFPTDIDPNPLAYKTKENFYKLWDRNTKEYSTTDLAKPIGKNKDGKVDLNNCYINNHKIGIVPADGIRTSWYWAWTQCSPGGSWRPVSPHVSPGRPKGSSHDGAKSSTGAWGVIGREYMVHFRNRALYVKNFNFNTKFGNEQGTKVKWNYLMGEVRSGNTTFGQQYSYDDDLNWASREFFGKSFAAVVAQERSQGCSMDSWDYVCAHQPDKDDLNPVKYSRGATCLNHSRDNLSASNPPTMVFSDYTPKGGFPEATTNNASSTTQSVRELSLADYAIFINCYKGNASCEADQKSWADINGDGKVDEVDLGLVVAKF